VDWSDQSVNPAGASGRLSAVGGVMSSKLRPTGIIDDVAAA